MRAWQCPAMAALFAVGAATAHAAEPISGRWAADLAFCESAGDTMARSPLVVTNMALNWAGDSCRVGRSYRTGDTLHIEAFCGSPSGERAIPVSLKLQGARLGVTWNRNVVGGMRKCPDGGKR